MMRIEKPYRRRQTAAIALDADPDAVFALMCPVREYEWEPGWTTNIILSNCGRVEQDCIFTTPGGASAGSTSDSAEAVWVTPYYDAKKRALTMIKFTQGECVTRLDIEIAQTPGGAVATVSYAHTALSESGRRIVDDHGAANFEVMMAQWKTAIEACLSAKRTAA